MRCPVCRAQVEQGPQCRRCRADLSLLFALEEQRARALAVAEMCLRRGKVREAFVITAGAEALRKGADLRRLRATFDLLQRDFRGAWHNYKSAARSEEPS
jgi:hypothetical protein